jgi:hypothetical protein
MMEIRGRQAKKGLLALVLWSALWAAGCQSGARTSLEALASGGEETRNTRDAAGEEVRREPLAWLSAKDVPALWTKLEPALQLAFPAVRKGELARNLALGRNIESLYVEVTGVRLSLDESDGTVQVVDLSGFLAVESAAPDTLAAVPGWLVAAAIPGTKTWSCRPSTQAERAKGGEYVVCADPESLLKLATSAEQHWTPEPSSSALQAGVAFAPLLDLAEEHLGRVLVWGVVPEELASFDRIELTVDLDADRIALELTTRDSTMMELLQPLARGQEYAIPIPAGSSAGVVAGLRDVESTAQSLQDWMGTKGAGSELFGFRTWLSSNWQTEMMDLSAGVAGFVVSGDLDVTKPMDSFVWLIRPADAQSVEARLDHVFRRSNVRRDERTLRTGEILVQRFRRGKGVGDEALSWFYRTGFAYLGSSQRLSRMAEDLRSSPVQPSLARPLQLRPNEISRGFVNIERLTAQLSLGSDGGFAASAAINMAHSLAQKVLHELEWSVVLTGPEESGQQRLSVQIHHLLHVVEVVSRGLLPLLGGFLGS